MIFVKLNEANFEYDIHSLVKAFYPGEEVTVSAEEKPLREELLFRMEITYRRRPQEEAGGQCEGSARVENGAHEEGSARVENGPREEGGAWAENGLREEAGIRNDGGDREGGPEGDVSRGGPGEIDFAFFGPDGETALQGCAETDFSDRAETKNRLKQELYRLLAEYSGRTLPWGTLTGIRPCKIPMTMLDEGQTPEEIRTYMKQKYFASDEKIGLSIEVARRERQILAGLDCIKGYSLYIGIPFCPTTCLYCSFTSYPITRWEKEVGRYLDALEKELAFTAEIMAGRHPETIYIGGGTPTTLSPEQMDRLLGMTEQYLGLSRLKEFTVEGGRPDSITAEKLQVLRDHGITRISINPQTMKQATLDLIGRRHTVEQTREAYALARSMGFDNINMDLIIGLPEETFEDVRATMEEMKALAPDNLTIHSLAVKRAARLRMQRDDYRNLTMENTWETISMTAAYAREMGLHPYYLYRQKNMAGNFENVGYAREGCEGLYNILIMEEKQDIVALGAGTVSKRVWPTGRIERCDNVKDITQYLERTDEMIERKRKLFTMP